MIAAVLTVVRVLTIVKLLVASLLVTVVVPAPLTAAACPVVPKPLAWLIAAAKSAPVVKVPAAAAAPLATLVKTCCSPLIVTSTVAFAARAVMLASVAVKFAWTDVEILAAAVV